MPRQTLSIKDLSDVSKTKAGQDPQLFWKYKEYQQMKLPLNIKLIILLCALLFCYDHPFLVAIGAIFYFSQNNFEPTDKLQFGKFIKAEVKDLRTVKKLYNFFKEFGGVKDKEEVAEQTVTLENLKDFVIDRPLEEGDQIIETDKSYKVVSKNYEASEAGHYETVEDAATDLVLTEKDGLEYVTDTPEEIAELEFELTAVDEEE